MQNERQIQEELALVNTLKMLTQAYEEISVLRMQRVRNSVLLTRDFLERLASVYHDVKLNYREEILRRFGRKGADTQDYVFSTIDKDREHASVLMTANGRLYGDIVRRVYRMFIEGIKDNQSDLIIVGKLGKEFFDQSGNKRKYKYIEIPDSDVGVGDLIALTSELVRYKKVDVYYGQFLNVVTQKPSVAHITGEQSIEEQLGTQQSEQGEEVTKFYFEPSLEKILYFFETQVFSSLMKQTTHEGELSRLASRVRAMEEAISNIEQREGVLGQDLRRAKRRTLNKKQLDAISGIYLWGEGL